MGAFAGKVVLVTGAGRRIGAAIATHLHAAGAAVAIHCRNSVLGADDLADSLNARRSGSAAVFRADLLDTAAIPNLVADVEKTFGRLDGLVNNASSFYSTPIGEIDNDDWEALVGSNFRAPLFLTQAAARLLRESRGAVVNIADIHGDRPLAGYPLYSAAKGGLLTLTRALAIELAPEVRVNAVAPGPIAWPEDDQIPVGEQDQIIAHTLLGREGSPEDIASAVEYLLAAGYVTGQVLNVDGGRSAHL